jgi:hypothetical protein
MYQTSVHAEGGRNPRPPAGGALDLAVRDFREDLRRRLERNHKRARRAERNGDHAPKLIRLLERANDPLCRRRAMQIGDCNTVRRRLRCPAGCGTFWIRGLPCLARLCPRCDQARAAHLRERLRRACEGRKGLRHVVFTLRGDPAAPLPDTLDRLLEGWKEIRRRAVWKRACVKATVRSIEITRGREGAGWHVHLHVLADSGWIDQPELSAAWLAITGDSFVVYVTRKTADDAIGEITKYVTKPAEVDKFTAGDVAEIVHALRGRRLVSFTGEWYGAADEDEKVEEKILEQAKTEWERIAVDRECPTCSGRLEDVPWGRSSRYDLSERAALELEPQEASQIRGMRLQPDPAKACLAAAELRQEVADEARKRMTPEAGPRRVAGTLWNVSGRTVCVRVIDGDAVEFREKIHGC